MAFGVVSVAAAVTVVVSVDAAEEVALVVPGPTWGKVCLKAT